METFVFDEFFDAVGNVEVSVGVLVADVAGFEIAVRREGVGCAFWVVVVAFEDVGAFDPEFAGLTDGELGFVGGHVFGGLVGEEGADGADGCAPDFPGLGEG